MRLLACLIATVLLLASCDSARGPGSQAAAPLVDCRLPRLATAARCTQIDVPENRSAAGAEGRRIRIHVAVLPANTLSPRPDPLFLLAGGPGQAASSLGPFAASLERVRRERDVVLVDQRGTGRSTPLACAAFAPGDPVRTVTDVEDPVTAAADCWREIEARGVDLAQYTTAAFVADLEDVRRALGYEVVNLWGGSYGTRVAQEYVRRHGARVRSAILDGVAAPSMRIPLDIWPSRDAVLESVVIACAQDSRCAAGFPQLAAKLDRLRTEYAQPRNVTVADPATGEARTVAISWKVILGALHPLTYAPDASSLVPPLIERAAAGDFAPLLATAGWVAGRVGKDVSTALHYAVVCTEDAPRVTPADVERTLARSPSATLARDNLHICREWPHGATSSDAAMPLTSDLPFLLLSGGLDPVTPPRFADEVAKTLANRRHIVAPGYGHIVSPHVCVPDLIGAFVEEAGFATLPQECVGFLEATRRPPLYASRLGPMPATAQ